MTSTRMRALLVPGALLCLAVTASAQDKAPRTSTPASTELKITHVDQLTLDNAQKDAIIAQQQAQGLRIQLQAIQAQIGQADAAVGAALKTLSDRANEIKHDHGWGDDVTFNQAYGGPNNIPPFTRTPQPAQPAAAAPEKPAPDANAKPDAKPAKKPTR